MSRRFPHGAATCVAAAVTLLAAGPARPAAAQRAVWELEPYRISVLVAPDPSPLWTADRLERLHDSLASRARSLVGAPWHLEVSAAGAPLRRLALAGDQPLEQSGGDVLRAQASGGPDGALDKVIVLVPAANGDGCTVLAREWDAATGLWGPPIRRAAASRADLDRVAFEVLRAAFSPLARVDSRDGDKFVVRPRAAGLPLRDSRLVPCQPGAVLRLARLAHRASGQSPSGVPLEWSFLVVEQSDGQQAVCRLLSRYRDPLADLVSAGGSWLALGVGNPQADTVVELRRGGQSPVPFVGCEVFRLSPDGSAARLGQTGPDGAILVPPASSPLSVLILRVGDEPLARLPLVPGWQRRLSVSLPLDDDHLQAATAVATLRGRLLELAARRELEFARANARAGAGKLPEAEQLLEQLRASQAAAAQALRTRVDELRGGTTAADATAQQSINRLWEGFLAGVDAELDPAKIDQLLAAIRPAPPPPAPPAETPAAPPPADGAVPPAPAAPAAAQPGASPATSPTAPGSAVPAAMPPAPGSGA